MGESTSATLGNSSGNRMRIRATTAGQAEEIKGRILLVFSISRTVAETISAARATSNTSLNPRPSNALSTLSTLERLRNWPYKVGAGRAMRCLKR